MVCSTSFVFPEPTSLRPPNFPRIHFPGATSTLITSALAPLLSQLWPGQGQLPLLRFQDHRVLEAKVGDPTTSRTRISSVRYGATCLSLLLEKWEEAVAASRGVGTQGRKHMGRDSTRPGRASACKWRRLISPAHSTTPTCSLLLLPGVFLNCFYIFYLYFSWSHLPLLWGPEGQDCDYALPSSDIYE